MNDIESPKLGGGGATTHNFQVMGASSPIAPPPPPGSRVPERQCFTFSQRVVSTYELETALPRRMVPLLHMGSRTTVLEPLLYVK